MIIARGFTLIELLVVIIILGIVSIFSFRFVGLGSEMYITAEERVKVLDQSRFTIERITRELRNSLPNSARVVTLSDGTECLEFVPIKAAGTYYNAPFSSSANSELDFVSLASGWEDISAGATNYDRLFIFATQDDYIYGPGSAGEHRWTRVLSPQSRAGESTTLELEAGYYYSQPSPRQRLFVGRPPVSFCIGTNGTVTRYTEYGWDAVPTSVTGVQVGSGIINLTSSGTELPFRVDDATLLHNNIVHVFLEYQTATGERLFFNQEINIPNAP